LAIPAKTSTAFENAVPKRCTAGNANRSAFPSRRLRKRLGVLPIPVRSLLARFELADDPRLLDLRARSPAHMFTADLLGSVAFRVRALYGCISPLSEGRLAGSMARWTCADMPCYFVADCPVVPDLLDADAAVSEGRWSKGTRPTQVRRS
jgi:hypothetical protein